MKYIYDFGIMKRHLESNDAISTKSRKTCGDKGSSKYDSERSQVNAKRFSKATKVDNEYGTFQTFPIAKFDRPFPYFREPAEFGAFSLGIDRDFRNSREKQRLYSPPDLSRCKKDLDLNIGYETFVGRNEDVPERLDHLLKWIDLHREKFKLSSDATDSIPKCLNTDFVTWRGHLVKILCTAYEKRDSWRLDACKYNGTIFICEVETEMHKKQRLSQSERQRQMCYWGYKFEDYMTKPISKEESSKVPETRAINNSEAFCSVIRTRLNKHSLLFGAEVDCTSLKDGEALPTHSYIELKTSRIMDNVRHFRNFANFKLIKYWAQSYLAGVPKVVCGLRDDNGIVQETETFDTLKIPNVAHKNNATWSASICMNFCDEFLGWMKNVMKEDDRNIVYSFRFEEPFTTVEVSRNPYGCEVFIPDWF